MIYMQNLIVYKRKNRFDNLYMRHNEAATTQFSSCKIWANWNYFCECRIIR